MAALATTHSLRDYSKLSISSYREQLKKGIADSIKVGYSYRNKPYSYSIRLDKTACNYGNYRHWWLYPKCSSRTSVLYCAGTYVYRHCIGACYGLQLQQPIDRLFSRIDAIRHRLEWQRGVIHGIGQRPKGMHHSTFKSLVAKHDRLSVKVYSTQTHKAARKASKSPLLPFRFVVHPRGDVDLKNPVKSALRTKNSA